MNGIKIKSIKKGEPLTSRPIYVRCDETITSEEEKSIIRGLLEAKRYLPDTEIYYVGKKQYISLIDHTKLSKGQDVIDSVRKIGNQLVSSDIIYKILSDRGNNDNAPGRIEVFFTGHDLTDIRTNGEKLNFVFGSAGNLITVQSVYRFRSLNDYEKDLCIKRTIRHELGHIYRMAGDLKRSNTEEKLGEHCTNSNCCMRQGMSVGEWLAEAKQEQASGIFYCKQCINDLKLLYEKESGKTYQINNSVDYSSIHIMDKSLIKSKIVIKSVKSLDDKPRGFRVLGSADDNSGRNR